MAAIQIRAFEREDIDAFNRVHNHPAVVMDILQPPFVSHVERDDAVKNSPTDRYLVAEIDGRAVGFGDLRLYSGRRAHVARIGLAVDPDEWKRGIGTSLVDALIDLGERWYGVRRFELKVFAPNARAIAIYKRAGFEVEAVHREFAYRDGELTDVLSMARLGA